MTKLQIISRLWSAIYDLIFLVKGTPTKNLEQIEAELDLIEYECRRYTDEEGGNAIGDPGTADWLNGRNDK